MCHPSKINPPSLSMDTPSSRYSIMATMGGTQREHAHQSRPSGRPGSPTRPATRPTPILAGKRAHQPPIGKIAPRALAPSWRPCGVSAIAQGTAHHSTWLRRRPKRFCSARRHTSERAFRVGHARRTRWNEVHYDQTLSARRSRGGRLGGCLSRYAPHVRARARGAARPRHPAESVAHSGHGRPPRRL